MRGASGSKLPRFLLAPCVELVAVRGAVEEVALSAEEDSGVWCETVPDTVSRMDGGVNEAMYVEEAQDESRTRQTV